MKKFICFGVMLLQLIVGVSLHQAYATSTAGCYDTDSKVMLHMDGTNGGTTFTDSSTSAHSFSAAGNAVTSTSSKKFGTASGSFDGSGDAVDASDSADWEFGSSNFTLEAWINLSALNTDQCIIGFRETGGQNDLDFQVTSGNKLRVLSQAGGSTKFDLTASTSLTTGVWYHVALVRSSGNVYIFLNGTQDGSTTVSGSIGTGTFTLRIGAFNTDSAQNLNGFIDEVRIVNGTAIWTSTFTPACGAYPDCSSASAPSCRRRMFYTSVD